MKKRWLQISVFVILFSLNACEENLKPQKEVPIELQSYENQKEFVHDNLKILGKSVLSLANDPEFREIVYQQIEKRVDGDDNVLLETLSKIQTSDQQTLGARMNNLLNIEGNIEHTLDKFRGIEGRDWYPQIYIPFYDKVKERREASPLAKTALVAQPVVVLFDGEEPGDDSSPVVTGFLLNDSGELTESNLEIDEEYAEENEVWVISLNERISDIDDVENSDVVAAGPSAVIDKMRCKCHKESWLAGASEVNIITIFSGNTTGAYLSNETYGGGPYQGGRIHKFTRSSVKDNALRTVNFGLNGYWDGRPASATYSHSVIFEYDIWPTRKRVAEWKNFAGGFLNVEYRSSDGYYTLNSIPKTSFSTYTMSNGCIEWSGR